jgi:cytochrome c5
MVEMARAIPYAGMMLAVALAAIPAGARQAPGAAQATPGDELPDGDGKKILVAACTSCHDLGEVTKFRGYWEREQWRAAVVTMVEYGAPVEAPQIDVLADYLTEHLGKRTER